MQKNCSHCEKEFSTIYRRKKYCSKRCGTLASHARVGRNSKPHQTNKETVYIDKISKGCSRCSEKRPACLQYHHIDPSNKLGGVGKLVQFASPERVIAEMKKCILLCANCHFVEENGDGYKPEDRPDV